MINDYTATVLEALGEKIASMKSSLGYEEWRSKELEEENAKLKKELAAVTAEHNALKAKLHQYIVAQEV